MSSLSHSLILVGPGLCCALLLGCDSEKKPNRARENPEPRHEERRIADKGGSSSENKIEGLFADESVLRNRVKEAQDSSVAGSKSIQEIIDHAIARAAKGDFDPARKLVPLLNARERFAAMESLMSVRSGLGTAFDLKNKETLLDIEGLPENLKPFWRQVAARESSMELDQLVGDGSIDGLGGEMVAQLFETYAQSKPKYAFDLLSRRFEQGDIAARSVMRATLSTSPGFAQKALAELPDGAAKDAAIFELLRWMLAKGESEHFHVWAEQIKDDATKKNAAKLLEQKR